MQLEILNTEVYYLSKEMILANVIKFDSLNNKKLPGIYYGK
jgi:hypothetical protein